MNLPFKKLHPDAILPTYGSAGAAGMDVHAIEDTELFPHEHSVISTGLAVAIPEGYELQCRPRSGLAAKHCLTVLNSPGTIDSDYRGEIKVILINHGMDCFEIKAGDRIAQLVMAPVTRPALEWTDWHSETERGTGGLGSTGR
jgi:dUTP pyrophosphatase